MSDPSLGMQDFASIDPQTKDLVTKSFCIIQLHTFLMVGRASFLISHKIFLRCAKFSIWRRNDECGVACRGVSQMTIFDLPAHAYNFGITNGNVTAEG